MSSSRETGTMIQSGMARGLQTYAVYDVTGRIEVMYEAPEGCVADSPCFVTTYKYDADTSIVVATKETVGIWNSSYDFDSIDPYNLP